MTKIMLVEDDNNLREIYEARLLAEGYEIVSAKDGEEALATAVKEKPDLIIADVMMPKISGFDMLDILRSTPETKSTKVIMMTALSQAEDKARAEKLGADRYLVKSQVTLEDVARVAQEVLTGEIKPTVAPVAVPAPEPPATVDLSTAPIAPAPAEPPVTTPEPTTITASDTTASPAQQPATSATDELEDINKQLAQFEQQSSVPETNPTPPATPTPQVNPEPPALPNPTVINVGTPPEEKSEGNGSSHRIIQPINDLNKPSTNLTDLAAKEDAMATGQEGAPKVINPTDPTASTVITPTIDSSAL